MALAVLQVAGTAIRLTATVTCLIRCNRIASSNNMEQVLPGPRGSPTAQERFEALTRCSRCTVNRPTKSPSRGTIRTRTRMIRSSQARAVQPERQDLETKLRITLDAIEEVTASRTSSQAVEPTEERTIPEGPTDRTQTAKEGKVEEI